jgi:hypothetical protein
VAAIQPLKSQSVQPFEPTSAASDRKTLAQIVWEHGLGRSLEFGDCPPSDFLHRGALGLGLKVQRDALRFMTTQKENVGVVDWFVFVLHRQWLDSDPSDV